MAVPLPPSFQEQVEAAIERLPRVSVVVQVDAETADADAEAGTGAEPGFSFVPIDPCQGVIAALRTARGERIAREFIDLETPRFVPVTGAFPDPYALKRVKPERFAAALLAAVPPPLPGQNTERIAWMAARLRELEPRYRLILLVCSILDWPWIRDAFQRRLRPPEPESFFSPMLTYAVDPRTLIFVLGELPYITNLYERGRRELTPDDNLSVDGVKEMVLDARERLRRKHPKVAQRITPQLLSIYFRYVRNLSLLDRRLTPDLYSLVVAAKQTAGDDFALALAETARSYPSTQVDSGDLAEEPGFDEPELARMGINQAELPVWGTGPMVSRLPGQALSWRTCELRPRPLREEQTRWRQRWDPFGMCSYPPEDDRIESFHRHVRDQARAILGADLARTEKFTTSIRDGIDIRETLRNWHTGDLYVKVVPPSPGLDRNRGLPLRGPRRSRGLLQSHHLVRRARPGIDAGLLRHGSHEKPGRAGDRPGSVRRCSLHLPTPPDPRRVGRQAARLHRHAGGTAARRGVLAQRRPPRRGRQSQDPSRLLAAGWPASSAARSCTCRSSGSAASFSSGCARFTCSTASKSGRMRLITYVICEGFRADWNPDSL